MQGDDKSLNRPLNNLSPSLQKWWLRSCRRATFHSRNSLRYSTFMGLWIAANTSAAVRSDNHTGLTSRPAINSKDSSPRDSQWRREPLDPAAKLLHWVSFKSVLSGNRRLVASSSSWSPPLDPSQAQKWRVNGAGGRCEVNGCSRDSGRLPGDQQERPACRNLIRTSQVMVLLYHTKPPTANTPRHLSVSARTRWECAYTEKDCWGISGDQRTHSGWDHQKFQRGLGDPGRRK